MQTVSFLFLLLVVGHGCSDIDSPSTTAAAYAIDTETERPAEELLLAIANQVERFAGYYCESGNLLVGFTPAGAISPIQDALEQSLVANIVESRGVATYCYNRDVGLIVPQLVVVAKTHNFMALRTWRDKIATGVFESGGHSLAISYSLNRLMIRVRSQSRPLLESYMQSQGLPPTAYEIVEERELELALSCLVPSEGLLLGNCFRPVPGGVEIQTSNNGATVGLDACTMTAATSRYSSSSGNWQDGQITAAHCVGPMGAMNSDWVHQPNLEYFNMQPTSHRLVGVEFIEAPTWTCGSFQCRYSDSAWMFHYQGGVQRGAIAQTIGLGSKNMSVPHPRFYIERKSLVVEGMQVEKVGRTTGWTTGIVTENCADEVNGTLKFVCSGRTTLGPNVGVESGDSGAPVFFWWWFRGVDSAEIVGLLFGKVNSSTGAFSPWSNVELDLGTIDATYTSFFQYEPPELATDIGVGASGVVWIVTNTPTSGGYTIRRKNGGTWTTIPGGATRVAVDPSGNAWVVDSYNAIRRWTGTTWVQMPGTATDIGIGADGSVWIVGATPTPGGFIVYRWNGASWSLIPGGAKRIAVDPAGNAWITADDFTIWRWVTAPAGHWEQVAGGARDVGIGSDGMVWVIGTWTTGGGYEIYRWTGVDWVLTNGGAVALSVGPAGKAWVVSNVNEIYRWY